jgi:hypothetical protein
MICFRLTLIGEEEDSDTKFPPLASSQDLMTQVPHRTY